MAYVNITTAQEKHAVVALYQACLFNVGSDAFADLEEGETWVTADDLRADGFPPGDAKKMFSNLIARGVIEDTGEGYILSIEAAQVAAECWV